MSEGRRPIQAIGYFFESTEDGFIRNPAAWRHVDAAVRPIVEAVPDVYRKQFGANLHSVYVQGSVVHGTAVPGFADLDTFGLVYPTENGFVWWQVPPWAAEQSDRLLRGSHWLTRVDFGYATYHEDFLKRNPSLAATIKTQALCVYGKDLAPLLPDFRPGPQMFVDQLRIGAELERLRRMAVGEERFDPLVCQAVLKRILRVGFELVMEREGRYTTSVYHCYDAFARHHPDHAADMRAVLELYLNPPCNALPLKEVVSSLGPWLLDRVNAGPEHRSDREGLGDAM